MPLFRLFLSVLTVVASLSVASAETVRLLAYGDSLSAGYQLPPGADFASRLETALNENGLDVEIVNASVSGDTTSAGLARLEWTLEGELKGTIDGVILELGANDALRGIDPAVTRKALNDLIAAFQARDIAVLLAGMIAPPNMGADYGQRFNAIFPELAEAHQLVFYPFFLDGVAAQPELNLADGMHPNEAGVETIVANILPSVTALVETIRGRD